MFINSLRLMVVLWTFLSSMDLHFLLTSSSGMFTMFFTEAKFLSTGHSGLCIHMNFLLTCHSDP